MAAHQCDGDLEEIWGHPLHGPLFVIPIFSIFVQVSSRDDRLHEVFLTLRS
jgi:hypothetical protein